VSDAPIAIVTGATRGIGRATAERLCGQGWTVIGVGRTSQDPMWRCDVSLAEDVLGLAGQVERHHGRVDALVNAAGAGWPSRFLDTSDELWARTLEVNLLGTVRMCRAVIPLMLRSSYRSRGIVNLTSQAAKTGGIAMGPAYAAAKAAVLCLTKSLAGEFARDGIRVNAVAPGIIDTTLLDSVPQTRAMGATLPLGRLGSPEDVAGVIAFLLSDDAAYLTGEIVDVNGGLLMD
jgi:3-oxoacyl-[acyl-carrier protein] reductase